MKKLIATALLCTPLLALAEPAELSAQGSFESSSVPGNVHGSYLNVAPAVTAGSRLPEPQTPALFGAGLLAIGFVMNRRQPR